MSAVRHSDPGAVYEFDQFLDRVAILEIIRHILRTSPGKADCLVLNTLCIKGCSDSDGIVFPGLIVVRHDDDGLAAQLLSEFGVPSTLASAGDADGLATLPGEVKAGYRIRVLLALDDDDPCGVDAGACSAGEGAWLPDYFGCRG
jgi:hypothetical protein